MSNQSNTNKLKLAENFRLMQTLESRKEDLQTKVDQVLADEMTELLGFRVTEANIKGVRYAWGIEKTRQVRQVPLEVLQLEKDIKFLGMGLSAILQTLGREVPSNLTEIINRNNKA